MAFPMPPKSAGLRPLLSGEWNHKTEHNKVKIIRTCFESVGLKSYIESLCQTCINQRAYTSNWRPR
jgi:hypothetical protein